MPRVSFVMAARNAERYVGTAVESVLTQTYTDLELVLVDDASTDRTVEIVTAFDDPRVRIESGPGKGIASAANVGLAAARGEYVARLDADDIALADRVALQVEFLDCHPEVVVVGAFVNLMDDDAAAIGVLRVPCTQSDVESALSGGRNPFLNPTVMFRAQQAASVGGYDTRLDGVVGEDGEFLRRLCRVGRGANLSYSLSRYRIAFGAVSNGLSLQPRCVQRRREQAMMRIRGGDILAADLELLRDIAAAAKTVDPELAYLYRVGKILLENHGDSRIALRYLRRAWGLGPASPRVLKNLLLAAARAAFPPAPIPPTSADSDDD
jgi:glycosyltransferase involved in cell wall biosynthesis